MSRPRRTALFITASYPVPDQPLLGIFVKEHARAAAAHYDVAVLHLDRTDDVRGGVAVDQIRDDEFPTLRVRYPRSPASLSYAGNLAAAALGYRHMRRHGVDPDVIHAHFFLAGVPAVVLGRVLRKPVVVTEQWSIFLPDDPATLSPLMQRAARFAFQGADLVLPVSKALCEGIRAIRVNARFRIVPNVVDVARFHPPASRGVPNLPRKIIAVGALYEAKGWEYLLEAVALLARNRDDFRVEIVGDGELREKYEALSDSLGITDIVVFRGWAPKEEVSELLRQADLFVLTSRYDSNPVALIEALATGLPVVATAVGGIPGMIGDGMGFLAEPRNPESIASRIATALDERWDHAAIARKAHERYSAEHIGHEFAVVYDEVIARRA